MIIAIDFDPEIGREIPFAIETLKRLQADRHKLINGKTMTLESDYARLEMKKF